MVQKILEGRLNEGPRLQRKQKDEKTKQSKAKQNKRNTRERRRDICKPNAQRAQVRATSFNSSITKNIKIHLRGGWDSSCFVILIADRGPHTQNKAAQPKRLVRKIVVRVVYV